MSNFNVEVETDYIVSWIKDYFNTTASPDSKAVVGISGGKDSSVVAALCVKALGKDRVVGVEMPSGVQKDIDCADKLIDHLGIRKLRINIKTAVDEIIDGLRLTDITPTVRTITNLPARIRMSTLYAVAQSINGRVANTSNYSEDYIGYASLFGDQLGDFAPIGSYTVTEVRAIGEYLGLPYELVHKVPIDGLSEDSAGNYVTDEDKIGNQLGIKDFTYERLDKVIRGKDSDFTDEQLKSIDKLHNSSLFKVDMVKLPTPYCKYLTK